MLSASNLSSPLTKTKTKGRATAVYCVQTELYRVELRENYERIMQSCDTVTNS